MVKVPNGLNKLIYMLIVKIYNSYLCYFCNSHCFYTEFNLNKIIEVQS